MTTSPDLFKLDLTGGPPAAARLETWAPASFGSGYATGPYGELQDHIDLASHHLFRATPAGGAYPAMVLLRSWIDRLRHRATLAVRRDQGTWILWAILASVQAGVLLWGSPPGGADSSLKALVTLTPSSPGPTPPTPRAPRSAPPRNPAGDACYKCGHSPFTMEHRRVCPGSREDGRVADPSRGAEPSARGRGQHRGGARGGRQSHGAPARPAAPRSSPATAGAAAPAVGAAATVPPTTT